MPAAASAWICSQNSRRALGSTPAVGSSSSSSCGSCRMQAASARRCFQPPDSVPASWRRAAPRPELLERALDRLAALRHGVDPRDEVEVLLDGQVLVQAEALGHVADLALDRRGLAQDVEAEAGAAAAVRRQQAAEHPDRGGLAAAVGAEEAEDLALARPAARSPRTTRLPPKLLHSPATSITGPASSSLIGGAPGGRRPAGPDAGAARPRRARPRPGRPASRGSRGCRSPAGCTRPRAR